MSENVNIYTDEEKVLLDKTRDIRSKIIDSMVKEGIPYKASDIRVLNEVLTSLAKDIQDSATVRTKYNDTVNQQEIILTVAETLKTLSKKKEEYVREELDVEPAEHIKNEDVLEGELVIDTEKLLVEDFLESDNKDM